MKKKHFVRLTLSGIAIAILTIALVLSSRPPIRSLVTTAASESRRVLTPSVVERPALSKPSSAELPSSMPAQPTQEIPASAAVVASDVGASQSQELVAFRDWVARFQHE